MYEQQIDSRGYFVYKNRCSGKTELDNPNLSSILLAINEKYASSFYSTYRCACKLYALQKALYTSYIPFDMVKSILNRHQLNLIDSAPSIKPSQLSGVLHDVYFAATRMGYYDDLTRPPNLEAASPILACFFWAVFDSKRTTPISVLELRLTLLLLCSHTSLAQVVCEHFRLASDHNLCVSQHRFEAMLAVFSKILSFLGEPDHLRPTMVQQITSECFVNYPGLVGLTEYQFSCLWKLSSLFSYYSNVVSLNKRLQDTQHVVHGSCYSCRGVIRGLRFKCQRCRNFSLCIDCFTCGYGNKQHNMMHKMFEISSSEDEGRLRCGIWLAKFWRWVQGNRYHNDNPSPSTYENMEAKLIDTRTVELKQTVSTQPPGILPKESVVVGTLSRASDSTMKRNISLFSSVEYNSFNTTQQKHLLSKLVAVIEMLEELQERYRKQVTECWNELTDEEQTSASMMHSVFNAYMQHSTESFARLKDITAQAGQSRPQYSSTPYRNAAFSLTAADGSSEPVKSKHSPAIERNKMFVGSSGLDKTELSERDISNWFHIDLPASGSVWARDPQSKSTSNENQMTINSKELCEQLKNRATTEDDLSYHIGRLRLDTQMANFRDLLLKVREIVDDSYSDNKELASSTQQIEKALDRIIAEEELKRAQQLV